MLNLEVCPHCKRQVRPRAKREKCKKCGKLICGRCMRALRPRGVCDSHQGTGSSNLRQLLWILNSENEPEKMICQVCYNKLPARAQSKCSPTSAMSSKCPLRS